jgi:plastocyanin
MIHKTNSNLEQRSPAASITARMGILTVFSIFFIVSIPCFGGTIKGKIESTKEFSDFLEKSMETVLVEKEDYYWLVENGVLPIQPPKINMASELTVALMKPTGTAGTGGIENVIIKGAAMQPGVLLVTPKTTVKFKNEDPFVHSIYSPDLGHSFDPEILPSRQLRQVQFLNPGIYSIQCEMTPHLKGYIIVDPRVVTVTQPGADATFLFENLPPGKYVIKIYFEKFEVGSLDIEIVDDKPVEAQIKLSVPKEPAEDEKKKEKEGEADVKSKEGKEKGKGKVEEKEKGEKAAPPPAKKKKSR